MKRENYQKAIKIFQSAIQLATEKKEAFLTKECGKDVEYAAK